ncbi:MAG: hypothetical protein ACYCSN_06475 [Acidobacteriaceae bacterium]
MTIKQRTFVGLLLLLGTLLAFGAVRFMSPVDTLSKASPALSQPSTTDGSQRP